MIIITKHNTCRKERPEKIHYLDEDGLNAEVFLVMADSVSTLEQEIVSFEAKGTEFSLVLSFAKDSWLCAHFH